MTPFIFTSSVLQCITVQLLSFNLTYTCVSTKVVTLINALFISSPLETKARNIPGIIGYITPETSFLSSPGSDIKFTDAVEAVRVEAEKLKTKGVDIIVALGHAGMDKICSN